MAHKHFWERQGLLVQYSGLISVMDVVTSINEAYGNAKFDAIKYRIVDLSDVTAVNASVDEMAVINAHDVSLSKTNPNLKFAIVAADETLQALAAAYDMDSWNIPWEMAVFSTLPEARQWVADSSADSSVDSSVGSNLTMTS